MTKRKMREEGIENQVKGRVEELKGKVRGDVGDALDDGDMHVKGRVEEMKGKVRRKVGELQEDLGSSTRRDDDDVA